MSSLAELQNKAIAETRRLIKKGNEKYGIKVSENLPIRFDIRETAGMAGQARGSSLIRYNPKILELNPEEFISRTVIHEVCHIICHARWPYGRIGHGPAWKQVMIEMGAEDISRLHRMETARNDNRPWQYVIPACGCEFFLTSQMHAKIQRGEERWCKKHKNHIVPSHLQAKRVTVKPVVEQKKEVVVRTGTKKEQALLLMRKHPTYTRGQIIDLFILKLEMGKAGASTYYQNLKNEV